jgi:predicted outer membrane repeat protein
MKTTTHLLILIALMLLGHPFANAKVVYVNTAVGAGGDGTSWFTAFECLQNALAQTVAGDEVWVAAGTYYPDDGVAVTSGDRTATFTLKQDVKLYGGFMGGETYLGQRNPETNVTVLSGEIWTEKIYWSLHVVTLSGSASLDGVTVAKGNANGEAAPFNQGGGVLVSGGSFTVNRCVFTTNAASSGGAIYSSSTSVLASNCTFSDNSATSYGGAIYTYPSSVTATNCTFSRNSTITTLSTQGGGAIYSSSVTAEDCAFSNNSTNACGGAIRSSSVTAKRCTFSGNFSKASGGAIDSESGNTATVTSCTFSGNTASSSGGAIYSYSSSLLVTSCTFVDNSSYYSGGAINSGTTTTSFIAAIDCTFTSNTASYSASSGGAIHSSSSSSYYQVTASCLITTTNCTFTGNTAPSGGMVASTSSTYSFSSIVATDCTFSGSRSSPSCGAIYSTSSSGSSSVTATRCLFSDNTTSLSGGAIFSSSSGSPSSGSFSRVVMTSCMFFGNAASSSGGAVYSSSPTSSQITATNCNFSGNATATSGGAIYSSCSNSYSSDYSQVTATNCTLSGNTATSGGAIYSGGGGSDSLVTVTNSALSGNTASSSGGAIYSSSVLAANCTLIDNLARGTGRKGGGIYASGLVKLFNSILWHTLAEAQDNLIYITSTGSLRNADVAFPSPLNQAKSIIKGGIAAISAETGAVVSLGETAVTILSSDPLFSNAASPVGPDGIWQTLDDGLRLQSNSPALNFGLSMYLPVDTYDLDTDENLVELLPVDLVGHDRIQGAALDLGAYETGDSFQPVAILTQPASTTQSRGLAAKFTVTATGYDLRFQWYLGSSGDVSQPITGATTASYTTPELLATSHYWVSVSNLLGFVRSQTATSYAESELFFTTGGNKIWFTQSATTHDGVSAGQSGVINHSQSTYLQTTVENAGTLSFWWRVSSQSSGDYLRFYIDGLEQSGSISGTAGTWVRKTFAVATAGSHTFKWAYTKNASTSSGSDCGWVDQVEWLPAVVTTTYQTWVSSYNLTGDNALMTANPSGDGINNLLKYAMGLNPNSPTLAATDGTKLGLPLTAFAAGSMKFTFIKDTAKSDLTYTVETCTNLTTWNPVTVGIVETSLAGTLVRVVVTLPVNEQIFCRLKVTE